MMISTEHARAVIHMWEFSMQQVMQRYPISFEEIRHSLLRYKANVREGENMNIGDWVVIERGGDADVGHVNGIMGELCEIAVMDIHVLRESDPKEILQVPCEGFTRLGAVHWYIKLEDVDPLESPEGLLYCPLGEPCSSHGVAHR